MAMGFNLSPTNSNNFRNASQTSESNIKTTFAKDNMAGRPSLPDTPIEKVPSRKDIEATFESIRGVIKASLRPLPTQTGDGSYITQPESTGLLPDLQKLGIRDMKALVGVIGAKASGKPTNDKEYLMEKVIQVRITSRIE